MAEDRLVEILKMEFSQLTEDIWKELKDLVEAELKLGGGEGEEKPE